MNTGYKYNFTLLQTVMWHCHFKWCVQLKSGKQSIKQHSLKIYRVHATPGGSNSSEWLNICKNRKNILLSAIYIKTTLDWSCLCNTIDFPFQLFVTQSEWGANVRTWQCQDIDWFWQISKHFNSFLASSSDDLVSDTRKVTSFPSFLFSPFTY